MKNEKQGVIDLGNGYALIVPEHSDTKKIMTSTGMLFQLWAFGEMEVAGTSKEKFKQLYKAYFDKITDGVHEKIMEDKN